jgi:hypothetical protein
MTHKQPPKPRTVSIPQPPRVIDLDCLVRDCLVRTERVYSDKDCADTLECLYSRVVALEAQMERGVSVPPEGRQHTASNCGGAGSPPAAPVYNSRPRRFDLERDKARRYLWWSDGSWWCADSWWNMPSSSIPIGGWIMDVPPAPKKTTP